MFFQMSLLRTTFLTASKLWQVGDSERKIRAFFVPFILSEGNFFNICVLSQCILYWILFQNIHTFNYQKTLLHTLSCLFSKSLKALSLSLSKTGLLCRNPLKFTVKQKPWCNYAACSKEFMDMFVCLFSSSSFFEHTKFTLFYILNFILINDNLIKI